MAAIESAAQERVREACRISGRSEALPALILKFSIADVKYFSFEADAVPTVPSNCAAVARAFAMEE